MLSETEALATQVKLLLDQTWSPERLALAAPVIHRVRRNLAALPALGDVPPAVAYNMGKDAAQS